MNRETKIGFIKGIINGTIDPQKVDKATLLPKESNFDGFTNDELEEYIGLITIHDAGQVFTESQEKKLTYYTDKYRKQNEQDRLSKPHDRLSY